MINYQRTSLILSSHIAYEDYQMLIIINMDYFEINKLEAKVANCHPELLV